MKKMKGKKVIILLLVVVLVIGLIAVAVRSCGKSDSADDSDTQQAAIKEPEGKMLLELTYTGGSEDAPTTSTVRFYDDRSFTCEALVSSMYQVNYTSTFDAQDGLTIERVDGYVSKCTEDAKTVLKLIGLPEKMPLNIVHPVEKKSNGGITLTVQSEDDGENDPAIIGVFELTADQLKELAEATKGVEAPKVEQEPQTEAAEETDPNAVNIDTTGLGANGPVSGDISFNTTSGTCTIPGIYFIYKECDFSCGSYSATYHCDDSGNLTIDPKNVTLKSEALALVFQAAGLSAADAKKASTLPMQAQHEITKTADGVTVRIYVLNPENGERYDGGSYAVSTAQLDSIRGTEGVYKAEPIQTASEPSNSQGNANPPKPVVLPEGAIKFDTATGKCTFPALAFDAGTADNPVLCNAQSFTTSFYCDAQGNLSVGKNQVVFYSDALKILFMAMGLPEADAKAAATLNLPVKYVVVNNGTTSDVTVYATNDGKEYNCGTLKVTAEQTAMLKAAAAPAPAEITGTLTINSMNFIKDDKIQFIQTDEVQTNYTQKLDEIVVQNSQATFYSPYMDAFLQFLGMDPETAKAAATAIGTVEYSYENGQLMAQVTLTDDQGEASKHDLAAYDISSDAFDGSDVTVTYELEELNDQSVPKDYVNKVPTGGTIEANYLKNGSYATSYYEEVSDPKDDVDHGNDIVETIGKYEIYYPKELETKDNTDKYPVVVMVNGTGVPASKYKESFEHLASWGFIVIGNENGSTGYGASTDKTLERILALNGDDSSIFFGKVDVDNIGVVGHSQGGSGVGKAITGTHAEQFKAAVMLSFGKTALSEAFGWSFDEKNISASTMLLTDGGDLSPVESLKTIYDAIPENVDKLMARRNDVDHGGMLYSGDGYVTAWFMYYLQGDENAGKAFTGEGAEIFENKYYQDLDTNLEHSKTPIVTKGDLTLDIANMTIAIPALSFNEGGFPFHTEAATVVYSIGQDNKLLIPSTNPIFYSPEFEAFAPVIGLTGDAATIPFTVSYEVTMNDDGSAYVQMSADGLVLGEQKHYDLGVYAISIDQITAATAGGVSELSLEEISETEESEADQPEEKGTPAKQDAGMPEEETVEPVSEEAEAKKDSDSDEDTDVKEVSDSAVEENTEAIEITEDKDANTQK